MSRPRPNPEGRPRPVNTAVLLRDAFAAINGVVPRRLAEQGHGAVRTAHGAVFQYLDEDGTTVSTLAERAEMTKQAMAELVQYLEEHGYLRRVRNPQDGRAKLVLPTARGREVVTIAQSLVPELEGRLIKELGRTRWRELRDDLRMIQDLFQESRST